tara:strand:- start:411 stop:794 length:384 start_codon:yes stop_codon:yes gene_type:complete
MNLKEHLTVLFKIIVVIIIYVTILFTLAPFVDHSFTTLHKEETNLEIMGEILLQLITVSIIWYYLNSFVLNLINTYININKIDAIQHVIGIVSGLMFIGLQTNLKNKLNYITHESPFRPLSYLFNNN